MSFWTRLGIFVVILGAFSFGAVEVFSRNPELHDYRRIIAGSFAGAGTLLWIISKVHGNNVDTTAKSAPVFTMAFCGTILAACGGIVSKVTPISQFIASPQILQQFGSVTKELPRFFQKSNYASARDRSNPNKGPLRIQGIFYRENGSSAIINGQTVSVGDRVGTAKIVAIERQSVTVEISEQRKTLTL
jgi:hypothetical protein